MVDVSKIKVGDEVTVVCKVTAANVNSNGDIAVKLSSTPGELFPSICVRRDWVATHTPAPREFKPGDRVIWRPNDQHIWKVIAIDDGMAWSRWDGYAGSFGPTPESPHWGKHDQHPLQDLRHADESE